MSEPLYYGDYLNLDRLLSAQQLRSETGGGPVHDEMLFVIVHQAYELWFKQILWELDEIIDTFGRDRVDEQDMGRAVAHLERIRKVQELLIAQVDVLETMTPLDFLDFRDVLFPASGFQSYQFRLIENKWGVRPQDRLMLGGATYTSRFTEQHRHLLEESESAPSLFDRVDAWLQRTPFLDVGEYHFWEQYRTAVGSMIEADRQVVATNPNLTEGERSAQLAGFEETRRQHQAIFDPDLHQELVDSGQRRLTHRAFSAALFINLYRDEPALQEPFRMLTLLMDIEEGFITWRYRHALMTIRMIGQRVGTGGSAGARWLLKGAERSRTFTDLFALSSFLVPRSLRPELPEPVKQAMRFRYQPE